MELYIGLMSGTSIDGIDAALVDFSHTTPRVIATHFTPYQPALRQQILALCQQGENEIHRLGELDVMLGEALAQATNDLLKEQSIAAEKITAIGSHGQTVRHSPHSKHPFTLQIGDPNTIAASTRITTIADFRRKDIALGGQGAPLVPAFHQHIFSSTEADRAIVNIGGIANITLLPKDQPKAILGYDTGPGNVLLDAWIYKNQNQSYDKNGAWAAQGHAQPDLLDRLLADPYFTATPPKSTGREHFNLSWLETRLTACGRSITAVDVQATLVDLTARSITDAARQHLTQGEILICGGGAHNQLLMTRLHQFLAPDFSVSSTEQHGVHPDWVEAMAFAWLAKQTLNKKSGNLPQVTGAREPAILGAIYY